MYWVCACVGYLRWTNEHVESLALHFFYQFFFLLFNIEMQQRVHTKGIRPSHWKITVFSYRQYLCHILVGSYGHCAHNLQDTYSGYLYTFSVSFFWYLLNFEIHRTSVELRSWHPYLITCVGEWPLFVEQTTFDLGI